MIGKISILRRYFNPLIKIDNNYLTLRKIQNEIKYGPRRYRFANVFEHLQLVISPAELIQSLGGSASFGSLKKLLKRATDVRAVDVCSTYSQVQLIARTLCQKRNRKGC